MLLKNTTYERAAVRYPAVTVYGDAFQTSSRNGRFVLLGGSQAGCVFQPHIRKACRLGTDVV